MHPNACPKFSFGKQEYRVRIKTLPDGRYKMVVVKSTGSKRVKMFKRGPRIKSMSALVRQITRHKYVFYGKRPCHWSWLGSMSVFTLNHLVLGRILFYARLNPKYPRLPF